MEVVVAGPTVNRQILLEEAFPTAALTSSTMTTTLPERVFLQYVQDSTAGVDVFKTGRRHWNLSGGATTVQVVNGPKLAMGSLAEAVAPYQNYVDLATTTSILRGDYIVIDRSQPGEEYLRVQFVDGNRLWFSSTHSPYSQPGLRNAHLANAPVEKVALVTMTAVTDYTLNAQTGEITEVTEFGAGNPVLVSYTTDFVMPEKYGLALNASPDQDESWGKWTGLALLDGTYSVAIWGETSLSVEVGNDTTTYSGASRAVTADFLVGTATTLEPVTTISSAQNCYSCHDDVWFHGSHRRGLDSCLICHGTAGGEDRPQYVAPNAPATTAGSIEFRHMLHKIHMGKDLANASTYIVNGFGSGYPNNYTAHSYEEVGFPSMVGGVKSCATCHGTGNDVWKSPPLRNHPAQVRDTRSWSVACSSCHDTNTARAHIDAQTSSQGAEACATCHGIGKKWGSDLMHKTR
jgi:hypothetical protein